LLFFFEGKHFLRKTKPTTQKNIYYNGCVHQFKSNHLFLLSSSSHSSSTFLLLFLLLPPTTGAAASVSLTDDTKNVLNAEATKDLNAADVDTPRGESAKAEVIRLRQLLKERYDLEQAAATAAAPAEEAVPAEAAAADAAPAESATVETAPAEEAAAAAEAEAAPAEAAPADAEAAPAETEAAPAEAAAE
jgi:hypothetical protein